MSQDGLLFDILFSKKTLFSSYFVPSNMCGARDELSASLVTQRVKNSPANKGDMSSIPGLGRSPGGGNGNPLQYSSLIARLVKNPPAMQETPVRLLGQEDPLEKG